MGDLPKVIWTGQSISRIKLSCLLSSVNQFWAPKMFLMNSWSSFSFLELCIQGRFLGSRPKGRFSKVMPQGNCRNNWGRMFKCDDMA